MRFWEEVTSQVYETWSIIGRLHYMTIDTYTHTIQACRFEYCTAPCSVPLYYYHNIGEIDDIPMDFNFDINDVTFSSRMININRGFVLFLGTVCQLVTPMILSSYICYFSSMIYLVKGVSQPVVAHVKIVTFI